MDSVRRVDPAGGPAGDPHGTPGSGESRRRRSRSDLLVDHAAAPAPDHLPGGPASRDRHPEALRHGLRAHRRRTRIVDRDRRPQDFQPEPAHRHGRGSGGSRLSHADFHHLLVEFGGSPLPQASRRTEPMKDRTSRGWHIVLSAALITLAVGSLLPLAVTFLTSIKRGRDLFDPLSTDFQPTLDNYRRVFQEVGIGFYMSNSLIVALASVVATLVLALLAAYGLCRMRMRGERTIALAMLCLRTVPAIALVLPYFLMAQFLGIVDTKVLLVIAHMTFGLPLAIWLLRGFMRELPAELDEAAKVDGAGH